MPALTRVQALTANQRGYNPLAGWQYEYAPYRALVRILCNHNGAAGTVLHSVFTGSQNVVERGPLSGGGTAGTLPPTLTYNPIEFIVEPGDRIQMSIDETAGATPTVNTFVAIDPVP